MRTSCPLTLVIDREPPCPPPPTIADHNPGGKDQATLLRWMEETNAACGAQLLSAQASAKTQGSLQSLRSKYHPLAGHPTFATELAHLPYEELLARMRLPQTRARVLAERSFFEGKPFHKLIFSPANLFPLLDEQGVPQYERERGRDTFAALGHKARPTHSCAAAAARVRGCKGHNQRACDVVAPMAAGRCGAHGADL